MPSRLKPKSKKKKADKKSKKIKKSRKKYSKKNSWYKKANISNIVCSYVCTHEKCHHLRFVKYLNWQKRRHNINFYPTLIPYQHVYHHSLYGIIKGIPDFHINHPFKDSTGKIIYTSLDIELKVGKNRLTKDEKGEIALLLLKEHHLVAVCYGFKACKKLMKAYRNPQSTLKILMELSWGGIVKREHVLNN